MENKPAKKRTKRGKSYRDKAAIEKFGARVREIRKAKKITQEELVRRTGFDLKQIGMIERGEVDSGLSHIVKIAEGLGVHPSVLLTDTPFESTTEKPKK